MGAAPHRGPRQPRRGALLAALVVLSGAGPAAAQAIPALPHGRCVVDPGRGGYRATLRTRLAPPEGRGVTMQALAVDCGARQAADAGRPDRPRRFLSLLRTDGSDTLPKERKAYLDTLATRFAGPNFLGRDAHAVSIAQRSTAKPGETVVSGAGASTLVSGEPWIVNLIAFNQGDQIAASRRALGPVVGAMQGR